MWLTRFTSRFGTPALAALGVGHKVEGLGFIAISGFALSASALEGQNLGARQEARSEEHTSELQSQSNLVCRLLLEKKKNLSHLVGEDRSFDNVFVSDVPSRSQVIWSLLSQGVVVQQSYLVTQAALAVHHNASESA